MPRALGPYQDLKDQPLRAPQQVDAEPRELYAHLTRGTGGFERFASVVPWFGDTLNQAQSLRRLAIRAPYGGGKSSFAYALAGTLQGSMPIVWAKADEGPNPHDVDGLERHVLGLIDQAASSTGATRASLLGWGCCVVVDDAVQLSEYKDVERAIGFLRELASLPNVRLALTLHEDAFSEQLTERLGLESLALPGPRPEDVRAMFQSYADRFGVVFAPDAVADIAFNSITPAHVNSLARAALLGAYGTGQRPSAVTSAHFAAGLAASPFSELRLSNVLAFLDHKLFGRMLLAPSFAPRDDSERDQVERWVTYGLATRVDGTDQYALTQNVFNSNVASVLSPQRWKELGTLFRQEPENAVESLHRELLMELLSRGVVD
ncbi:MAG: hypothetical protein ACKVPX_17350 [Myxococcaceae bacterium]